MSTFKLPLRGYSAAFEGSASDLSNAVMSKTVTLQAATLATVDGTTILPANAQIVSVHIFNNTLWTATTASLTIGSASLGTEYMTGVNVKTQNGFSTGIHTAAQCTSMSNIGTNKTVYCSVASTGQDAVGTTKVVINYVSA